LLGAAVLVALIQPEAHAQSVRIVALGASPTAGYGVGQSAAWPARLEALLRARGIAATVDNAGVSGDTARDMLARLDSAVPAGTRLVILQANAANDQSKGQSGEFLANVAKIKARLAARKIGVVRVPSDVMRRLVRRYAFDGRHPTAEGQAKIAEAILPQVLAALRR
jgi:acyl-CoA thioesterase-1